MSATDKKIHSKKLKLEDINIDMLRIETANVKRIYDIFVIRSIIPYGILMNYNSSIGRLYMNNSLINNESNKTYNEAFKDSIKDADDIIIMDDRLIDVIKDKVALNHSCIIEHEGEETYNYYYNRNDKDIKPLDE